MSAFAEGQRLRHHAGSEWVVIQCGLQDDAFLGYYRIRCMKGTERPDRIGGEREGTVRRVHRDYLHGDGWRAS